MSRTRVRKKSTAVLLSAIIVLSMFAVAGLGGTAAAASQTLTVDDDYSDSEDTDSDTEYKTLQAAVDAASPGATIEVKEGDYDDVTIDKEVHLVAVGSTSETTIRANGTNYAVKVGADDVVVRGFTIYAEDGALGMVVEDMVDTHVDNLLVEDNHFTSVDGARAEHLVQVNDGGSDNPQDVTFRNNRFSGKAFIGFEIDADMSTFAGNTHHVDAGDQSRGAIIRVRGHANTLTNTDINFPANAVAGMILRGTDHTVSGLSVDGHLDHHQHESDRLDIALAVIGSGHSVSDALVEDSEVGVLVTSLGVSPTHHITLTNIESRKHKYYDSYVTSTGHDLRIGSNTHNVTVDGFSAMSDQVDTNVWVAGTDHTLMGVESTTSTSTGIWLGATDSAIKSSTLMNKGVGIAMDNASGSGVWTSDVMSNGEGIDVYGGEDITIESNNGIENNGVGVHIYSAHVDVLDNTIANNGIGVHVEDGQSVEEYDSMVDVHWNDIVGNDQGIVNDGVNTVNGTMNWFGSKAGPGGAAKLSATSTLGHGDTVSDGVTYDPFLTAPKDNVPHDWESVEQFGHDLELEGGEGFQTVAFPGPAEANISEALKDLSNRPGVMVWGYDQDDPDGPWLTGAELANESVSSLDAFIVTGLSQDAEVTIDHLDSQSPPNGPGQHEIDAGWNFVGASQSGNVEAVFQSTADLDRVVHVYHQPGSQPYGWAGDTSAFAHTFGVSGPTTASPYTGYWVFSEDSGQLSAVMPGGTSACDEIELLSTANCS